jgi:SH3-like domain-containing protein
MIAFYESPLRRSWIHCKSVGFFAIFFMVLSLSFTYSFAEAAATTPSMVQRFGSLKSSEVNVRSGPGSHYPILWVLIRKGLPVRILAEFDNWRKIEDFEGKQGWIHQSLLNAKQTVIVLEKEALLKNAPCPEGQAVARLEKGVIASLLKIQRPWCHVYVEKVAKGWVHCQALWGIPEGSSDTPP